MFMGKDFLDINESILALAYIPILISISIISGRSANNQVNFDFFLVKFVDNSIPIQSLCLWKESYYLIIWLSLDGI